jgi:hypothetical protein
MAEYDWGGTESALKQQAGQWYDPTMLQDVQRNVSYGAGDSVDQGSVDSWVGRIANKAKLRGSNEANSTYEANGQGGVTIGPTGKVNDPNGTGRGGSGGGSSFSQQWAPAGPTQAQIDNKAKSDALYGRLLSDSQQSLAIDRNDPIIRAQADAYAANEERAKRNYISDIAEQQGPLANIQGERRMAAERAGQRSGQQEAGLLGSELTARRASIQDRLHSMQGMLSAEQQNELQRELALMDQSIRQQQVNAGISGQNMQNDQFMRDLGLREWDTANKWNYNNTYGT